MNGNGKYTAARFRLHPRRRDWRTLIAVALGIALVAALASLPWAYRRGWEARQAAIKPEPVADARVDWKALATAPYGGE